MKKRLIRAFNQTLMGEMTALVGPYVLARWRLLAGSAFAVGAATAADVLRPWPLKFVFDYLLEGVNFLPPSVPVIVDPQTTALLGICVLIFVVWMLSSVAAYFGSYLSDRLAEEVVFELRVALFSRAIRTLYASCSGRRGCNGRSPGSPSSAPSGSCSSSTGSSPSLAL
jgi:ABC-type multidrug transport system fused ATPase/permease subunit